MSYDCFISYASADLAFAEELHRRLVAAGFTVWFDKVRLQPGCDWHRDIEQGAEDSRIKLPVLTPRWRLSEWTKFETYGAEAVIPILCEGQFEDVSTSPLTSFQSQTMDFRGGASADWPRMFAALRTLLAEPPPDRTRRLTHLRYRANPYFVGREEDLLRIHEQLHENPTAVLTQGRVRAIAALGGVGKTTLARQYAEKFWRLYPQIFWVDTRLGYESEFAHIFDLLFPDLANAGLTDDLKARRTLEELNSRDRRLLILDNAEDEATAQAWIPKTGGCHTLLTSRFAGWSAAIQTIHLYVLEKDPSRTLLLRRSGWESSTVTADELAACETLAEKLGYLPLALEQAAAYIGEQGSGFGFSDYLKLYEQSTAELLALQALGSTEYPDPVITTWKTTVTKLPAASRVILRLAAFVAATPLPIQMFVDSAKNVRTWTESLGVSTVPDATTANDEFFVRQALTALKRYSMAQFDGRTTQLHGLVQTVERLSLTEDERGEWWQRAVKTFNHHAPRPPEDFAHWPAWRVLLPHGESLHSHVSKLVHQRPNISLLFLISGYLVSQGRFSEATGYAILQWKEAEEQLGPNDLDLLSTAHNLADCYLRQGNDAAAEPLLRRVVEQSERLLGAEHSDTLSSLCSLANVLSSAGDFEHAEPFCRRALDACERVLGAEHPTTLISLNNLAILHYQTGDYEQAEPLLHRALVVHERVLGDEHPDTLTSLNNLATLFFTTGDYEQAEPLLRRTLEACERVLGDEHPDTLLSLNNLAMLHYETGDYEQAEPLLRRALEACERVLGDEHPNTLLAINNLAVLLYKTGDFEQAEPLQRRVLEARERVQGAEHPDTLAALNNLAALLYTTGDYEQAEPFLRRALEANERVLGTEHPNTLMALGNLANLFFSNGEQREAKDMMQRAVAGFRSALGDSHPHTQFFSEIFARWDDDLFDEEARTFRRSLPDRRQG